MKKYLTYLILGIGFYICTCLSLLALNIIGIGSFVNITGEAFPIALYAGVMFIILLKLSKIKSLSNNK